MSFNSKMKAIADPIRMLRNGFASDEKLTLDEMATGLERTVTDINDAYDVIGNKGGTVPNTQATCNLVSAINSIPSGATIKRYPTTGTNSVRISGSDTTVNCGFKPDAVFLFGTNPYYGTSVHAGVAFTEANVTSMATFFVGSSTSYLLSIITATQTSTGFKIKGTRLSTSCVESDESNRNINYVAVKYTE